MKIKNGVTELMVEKDKMEETISFYTDLLGFNIFLKTPEKDAFFVILEKDDYEIMLYTREMFSEEIPKFAKTKIGGSIALYIRIEGIEQLYTDIKSQVEIIQEIHETDYSTKEFSFEDNNGYVIMLAETVESDSV